MAPRLNRMAKDLTPTPKPRRPRPLHPPVTVPISIVRGTLAAPRQRGLDPLPCLLAAGIAPARLDEPAARVTAAQYTELFRQLIRTLDDEALACFSRPLRPGSLALLARSTLGAATLGQALARLARTWNLMQDDLCFSTQDDPARGWTALALRPRAGAPGLPGNFCHELLLRVVWRLLAWLQGGRLPARQFDFAFAQPGYAADYGRVFPAPWCFDAPCSALWLDRAALAQPVRRDEAALRVFLAGAPGNVIVPRQAGAPTSTRVRHLLQQARPDWPELAAAARALHQSPATLQRHLAAEGTSFQGLKDELRRDLAIHRLQRSTAPLGPLAAELGFADSASFQRAFKRWTGQAPGAYRRQAGPVSPA